MLPIPWLAPACTQSMYCIQFTPLQTWELGVLNLCEFLQRKPCSWKVCSVFLVQLVSQSACCSHLCFGKAKCHAFWHFLFVTNASRCKVGRDSRSCPTQRHEALDVRIEHAQLFCMGDTDKHWSEVSQQAEMPWILVQVACSWRRVIFRLLLECYAMRRGSE